MIPITPRKLLPRRQQQAGPAKRTTEGEGVATGVIATGCIRLRLSRLGLVFDGPCDDVAGTERQMWMERLGRVQAKCKHRTHERIMTVC